MAKILIPRSSAISAKTVVPTDFEKYFTNVVRDYIIDGLTVTASTGTNRSIDVSSGTARLKGLFINNDASETTAHTFGSDDTHYLYITLSRDGNSEPQSWAYSSNTTGTIPTDSLMLAKVVCAGGDVSSVDQTIAFKTMSHMHTFVGTGAQIAALTPTYVGQQVFCTETGSGYVINKMYMRNNSNSAFENINTGYYGTGADGSVTISTNTTLAANKNYSDLTVDAGITLNTAGYKIYVSGTLTVQSTGIITDLTSGNGEQVNSFYRGFSGGAGGAGGVYTSAGAAGSDGSLGGAGGAAKAAALYGGGSNNGKALGGGGSGAGGDTSGNSGSGGAGGSAGGGGGVVIIYAHTLNNIGTIHSNGQTAGNGTAGVAYGGSGGGGGGSGSGGTTFVTYSILTNIGTITSSGQMAGSGGSGYRGAAMTGGAGALSLNGSVLIYNYIV